MPFGWPTKTVDMFSGLQTPTAAPSPARITVPKGKCYKVHSIILIVITDATVANRTIGLHVRRPVDEYRVQGLTQITGLPASQTRRVMLGHASPAANYTYADSHSALNPEFYLPEDYFVAFEVDANWKAGDVYDFKMMVTVLPM